MVVRGRVKNGVVVLEDSARLPEGTAVTVVPESDRESVLAQREDEPMPEAERRRILDIMEGIASLPIEGKTDSFSARDHDKVLYGKPS